MGGQIAKVYVDENQVVKAGNPIADIDTRDLQVAVENAQAALATAEANAAFQAGTRVADYVDGYWQGFVVAESDGEVVGMVHWQGDFIGALHVDPRQARRGIGSALLRHAEAGMLADGVRIAQLETDTFNLKARGFYAAHGYAEAVQYPDEEWNSGLTTVLMVKALQSPSQP